MTLHEALKLAATHSLTSTMAVTIDEDDGSFVGWANVRVLAIGGDSFDIQIPSGHVITIHCRKVSSWSLHLYVDWVRPK